jgi:hypothetical protein
VCQARLRHEEGASGRIDLGARLGPEMTACIGVTTRGVRASHRRHKVPGQADDDARYGHSSVVALTIAPCFAEHSRICTRTPNRLTTLTSGALTTSGSDDVAAVGGDLTTAQMVVLCRLEAHEPK